MYFTFSKESSFGADSTSQDYMVDLVSEEVITNVNYEKFNEFNYPTSRKRHKGIETNDGRIDCELTYHNQGWEVLFETLIGQSVTFDDVSLGKTSNPWLVLTGMLASDIGTSEETFTITESTAGEFDNVDYVIIGNELIAINSISDGVVSSSSRHSGATEATSHSKYDLVYGVVNEVGTHVTLISRYRDGFCYHLPTSLNALMFREGDYFSFSGSLFSDYVFNAESNSISASFQINSRNVRIIELDSPSVAADDNQLISPLDIRCFMMGEELLIQKLYLQVSNTLARGGSTFLSPIGGRTVMLGHSAYGQFTVSDETSDAWLKYKNDNQLNLSVAMCNDINFEEAHIFSFNKIKYGTLIRALYSKIDMLGDSVPFYTFDPDGFTVIIQRKD